MVKKSVPPPAQPTRAEITATEVAPFLIASYGGTGSTEVILQRLDCPPPYAETLQYTPTLRIWDACLLTLGYFPIDMPWSSVRITGTTPAPVMYTMGKNPEWLGMLKELDDRVATTVRNLECNGGKLPVHRTATDSADLRDAYIRQADFWPVALRMGWDVPEYAREFLQYVAQNEPEREPRPAERIKPVSQQHVEAVLVAIRAAGYDPLALPKGKPGLPGVKKEIRDACQSLTSSQFDHTWEGLRGKGRIAVSGNQ